ncbi:hypothetical protein HOY82DRAFT_478397 [Tuber indicum]|nr:hypothetical protein HOY82DRAFT_478397 [Tuber indicum]
MLAACSGSLFTSLLVTPLDVVRVRLQSQQLSPPKNAAVNFSSASPLRAHKLPLAPLQFQSMAHLSTPELGVTACCREVFWINNTSEASAWLKRHPVAVFMEPGRGWSRSQDMRGLLRFGGV